jgi:biotin carboxyl carrier protein
MPVEEVQQFIDLLENSPMVTELSVHGAGGSRITIKKRTAGVQTAQTSSPTEARTSEEVFDQSAVEVTAVALQSINATLVGLFHPATPALEAGSAVAPGQIVGYIESMRLMNEVVSTAEGVVELAAATEGQPVEYGQLLFAVSER